MVEWFRTASGTELVLVGFVLGVVVSAPAVFQFGWHIGRWWLCRSLLAPRITKNGSLRWPAH